MKRLLALILTLVFVIGSVLGCQTAPTPTASPATKSAPAPSPAATKPAAAAPVAAKPTAASSTASSSTAAKPSKPANETLTVATTSLTSENALPNLASSADLSLWSGLYDYLIFRDPKTAAATVPGLAEKWEVSKDLKNFTYYLRKGVQFHGTWGEVTAEDVKFTFELATSKGSLNPNASEWSKSISSITVNNPYEITISLKEPNWQFNDNMTNFPPALPIVSKKYVEKVGQKEANEKPVGSGPYKLAERRAGDFIKFEALDTHWRKVPEFKWVVVKSVPEAATRMAMLKSGEADIAPVPTDRVAEIKKAGLRTVSTTGSRTYWAVLGSLTSPDRPEFSIAKPWWADPANQKEWDRALKVRKAMNLAVNRQEINDKLFDGTATILGVAPYGIPGQNGGYEDTNRWKPYPYDPQQAKQLLAEAGYPNGFDITVLLLKHSGRPEAPQLGEAIAMYWENIGLKVKRQPMDFDTLRPQMYARTNKEAWVFGARYYPEPIVAAYRLSTKDNGFLTGAELPVLEDLAQRGYAEVDPKKRGDIAAQFAQAAYDNYVTVPLLSVNNIWALSNRVGDWQVILSDGFDVQQLEYATLKR